MKAIPYLRAVRQFALSNGIKYFTVKQQRKALCLYEIFQAIKN